MLSLIDDIKRNKKMFNSPARNSPGRNSHNGGGISFFQRSEQRSPIHGANHAGVNYQPIPFSIPTVKSKKVLDKLPNNLYDHDSQKQLQDKMLDIFA